MSAMIQTELAGKINNLPSFKSEALLPLFEAVVNAIQAIEDRKRPGRGTITVRIQRDQQMELDSERARPVNGFEIEDNGIGFNDENLESFQTADSTFKIERGCKGIGRFYWLKAFTYVQIESVYESNGQHWKRDIRFTREQGIKPTDPVETDGPPRTVVKLIGYNKEYQKQPSSFKTTSKIAQRILEHCLSYFIANTIPEIIVTDGEHTERLDVLFSHIKEHIDEDKFIIEGHEFHISHIKLYGTRSQVHDLVLCGNSRDVKRFNISRILGTSQQFDDQDQKFFYAAYVSGDYLDHNVGANRISFDLPDKETLVSPNELKIDAIIDESQKHIKEYLATYLQAIHDRKIQIAGEYISEKNPSLRSVMHYCPEAIDEIEPNSSEEKIDEVFHKYKGKAEYDIRRRGDELLKTQASSVAEIKEEYEGVTERLEQFQRDQLVGYIVLRRMIIDLLEKKLELDDNGNYVRENIVHDILFPRKSTTDELDLDDHNLWLIDERLTFHTFATSDGRLCDISNSESKDRPDILAFAEVDEDKVARVVSIVELKRPERQNIDEDPTRQMLRYVREIRKSKTIRLPNGRELQVADETRCYCYALCDLTEPIKVFAESHGYSPMKGELGYYTYNANSNYNCHIEVIGYSKLVTDAQRRHKMFFEKLGIRACQTSFSDSTIGI